MIPYIAQPFSNPNPNWETIELRTTDPLEAGKLWNNGGVVTFSAGGGGGSFSFFRPGGVDSFLRPGGIDTYLRP